MIHHLINFVAAIVFLWAMMIAPALGIIVLKYGLKKLGLYDDD